MSAENPKKDFKFITPIAQAANGGITRNFPLGLGAIDYTSIKKNTPHFEELATTLGLRAIKGQILKNTLQFFTSPKPTKKESLSFPADAATEDEPLQKIGTSVFGMPVYADLSIKAGSYNDNSGEPIAQYDDIRIPAVIFEVSRETNLITTDIQGRENTVVEYVSQKSWVVNCKGVITSRARNTYPTTDVVQLINALNSNKSIKVTSWYLNMLGIYNLVIKKKTLPQEEGGIEYQRFEFEAIADNPVILRRPK